MASTFGVPEHPPSDSVQSRYPPPLLAPPSLAPSLASHPPTPPLMGKEKERSRIDIILDAPYVILRGTSGTTVEPALLSGHVSLHLIEDTDIKEVSLHLRGKAKIPVPSTESLINSSVQSYTFCSHDWCFLESACNFPSAIASGKRSSPLVRTLKAGKHIFPFTFTLTGNFPSTLTTHPLDLNTSAFPTNPRACITYKLRAVASRPGLSLGPGPLHNVHMPMILHNLTCTMPVYVLRSLSPATLEYQQSLEMENTWPEKLMYAIMLPHRAWAAGDTLIAVIKLSPIAKGVWVESVVTSLLETTELHVQQHHHLKNSPHPGDKSKMVHSERRIVRCVKHEIVNGKAVRVDLFSLTSPKTSRESNTPAGIASRTGSRPGSPTEHPFSGATSNVRANIADTFPPGSAAIDEERLSDEAFEDRDIVTYITFPIPHLSTGPCTSTQTTTSATPPPSRPGSSTSVSRSRPSTPPYPSTYSPLPSLLPPPLTGSYTPSSFSPSSCATVSPTHALPPVVVSHRMRWSFFIRNPDGHTSELRCSLPIHILDGRVLSEAREASVLTRRMTLVAEGLWRNEEDEEDLGYGSGGMAAGTGESNESGGDIFVDRELPSYHAHVRDRVANMYYSEMATVRVPWVDVITGGESTTTDNANWDNVGAGFSRQNLQSLRHSHVQYQRISRSTSGRNTPGHLSAFNQPHPNHHHLPQAPSSSSPPSPLDWVNSELMSLSFSSPGQREANNNATLPADGPQTHSEVQSRSESPERISSSNSSSPTLSDGHGQGIGQPVRSLSGFFKATMKPFTALSHGNGLFGLSKSSSRQDDVRSVSSGPSSPTRRASTPPTLPSTSSFPTSSSSTSRSRPSIIHRSLSEVPDYSVASQGFMGGVPPLSSLMGLPSYEEAARVVHQQPQARHGGPDLEERPSTSRPHGSLVAALPNVVVTDNSTSSTPRETASDTNLLGRFGRSRIQQRLERRDSASGNLSGSEEEEEGIQMRTCRVRG